VAVKVVRPDAGSDAVCPLRFATRRRPASVRALHLDGSPPTQAEEGLPSPPGQSPGAPPTHPS
jgi:hypothetical protein